MMVEQFNIWDDAQQYHWFVATTHIWVTNASLLKALTRVKREDDMSQCCYIWRVPGKDDTEYKIRLFAPEVDGAECIGKEILRE